MGFELGPTDLHFCLNKDGLTDEARQVLRRLCARHLPAFSTSGATLMVVGHADTLGGTGYNFDLSKRRADNVVRAIQEILGQKFQIKKIQALGLRGWPRPWLRRGKRGLPRSIGGCKST